MLLEVISNKCNPNKNNYIKVNSPQSDVELE